MKDFASHHAGEDQVISFLDFGRGVRKNWRLLLLLFGVFEVLALASIAILPKRYTVSMLVMPAVVDKSSTAGAMQALGSLGSLGSSLGISLGNSATSSFDVYEQLLTSVRLAQRVEQRPGLMPALFAQEWNPSEKNWQEPGGFRGTLLQWLRPLLGRPAWSAPDERRLAEYIDNNVDIKKVSGGFRRISIRIGAPKVGVELLETMHLEADRTLREAQLQRTRTNVKFLLTRLGEVSIAENRAALASLLASEQRTLMLASSNAPFAAEIVDGPWYDARPTSPSPVVTIVAAAALAVFLGLLIILLRVRFEMQEVDRSGSIG